MKNHPLIGKECTYRDGETEVQCKIVAVKAGPMVADGNSPVGSVRVKSTIKLQMQPIAGGPKMWSAPMHYEAP